MASADTEDSKDFCTKTDVEDKKTSLTFTVSKLKIQITKNQFLHFVHQSHSQHLLKELVNLKLPSL